MAEEIFKESAESKSDLPVGPHAVFEIPKSKATRYVEDKSQESGQRAVHGVVENRKVYFPIKGWLLSSPAPDSHRDLQRILSHMQVRKRYRFKGFLNINSKAEKRLAAYLERDLRVADFADQIEKEEAAAFSAYEKEQAAEVAKAEVSPKQAADAVFAEKIAADEKAAAAEAKRSAPAVEARGLEALEKKKPEKK